MQDSLVGPLRVVSVLDPAIDLDATVVEVYRSTRTPDLVVTKPGHHAKWATVRPLTAGEFLAVDAQMHDAMKLKIAFQLACTSIENFEEPGIALRPTKSHKLPDGRETEVWADDEFQRIADRLGFRFVYEIGQIAYDRAVAGNGWSGSVSFTLPPSLELELLQRMRLHVAQSRVTDGTGSSGRSANESAQTRAAT